MILGLVPAAGHSRRMGQPKLSLPLGDRTVLEHVIAALFRGGADHVLVVAGPHVAEVVPLAANAGADVNLLAAPTPDMRATIEAGLTWLEERLHPRPEDAWLLSPADQPTLDPAVVESLRAARERCPDKSIFVPTWHGKRGHPTLIAWRHASGLRGFPAGFGLNAYLRGCTAETDQVPALTADVLLDLDTPQDYEALCRRWGS